MRNLVPGVTYFRLTYADSHFTIPGCVPSYTSARISFPTISRRRKPSTTFKTLSPFNCTEAQPMHPVAQNATCFPKKRPTSTPSLSYPRLSPNSVPLSSGRRNLAFLLCSHGVLNSEHCLPPNHSLNRTARRRRLRAVRSRPLSLVRWADEIVIQSLE